MAITAQELQNGIDALVRALSRGELTVEYADRRVTYRSVVELERALDRLRLELQTTQGTPAATTQSVVRFTRD